MSGWHLCFNFVVWTVILLELHFCLFKATKEDIIYDIILYRQILLSGG
ncbi:Hypothetical protein EUBREC_0480 [Agathobacter rectalis ATCC 33656]|uniref:Uncharacterized protein n=1 Tax=Agathobacter rectalis (strain ATCC 33656 / DSM 3377 / JCM 17463 / KCTC 5835 / VPI 0990) TaxID=515619 RepID=C4ZBY1_AGARV|nr:Hypothetical protein EUBREC_0480 [Agathobacter rectalis ATCC 33656]